VGEDDRRVGSELQKTARRICCCDALTRLPIVPRISSLYKFNALVSRSG
jgi:hypothetical protein